MDNSTITISLMPEQQIELERIVMDDDKASALEFLKQVNEKIQRDRASHMKREGI